MPGMIKQASFFQSMPDWVYKIIEQVQAIQTAFTNKDKGLRASIINFNDILSLQHPCRVDDLLSFFMVMEVFGT